MATRLYIGNLSYQTTDDDLRPLFSEAGEVASATVITERDSGRSKGFGFVEMPDRAEAQAAIENLNGKDLLGQKMNVNEARPRTGQGRSGGQGGHRGRSGHGGRSCY